MAFRTKKSVKAAGFAFGASLVTLILDTIVLVAAIKQENN